MHYLPAASENSSLLQCSNEALAAFLMKQLCSLSLKQHFWVTHKGAASHS